MVRWRIIFAVMRRDGEEELHAEAPQTQRSLDTEHPVPPLRRMRELGALLGGYGGLLADRLFAKPPAHETVGWEAALRKLDGIAGRTAAFLEEPALREVEEDTRRLLARGRPGDPFTPRWAADSVLARCCYLACRLLQPAAVVETGVAYGVSAAFILRALEENGHGRLYSVDLPPLRRRYRQSWTVAADETSRSRWTLLRGSSRRVLPALLKELGAVDLFVHDSLHTRRNMSREFGTVWPRLREGGVLIADDVERNRAFSELQRRDPSLWLVVRDREWQPLHGRAAPVVFGIAVK